MIEIKNVRDAGVDVRASSGSDTVAITEMNADEADKASDRALEARENASSERRMETDECGGVDECDCTDECGGVDPCNGADESDEECDETCDDVPWCGNWSEAWNEGWSDGWDRGFEAGLRAKRGCANAGLDCRSYNGTDSWDDIDVGNDDAGNDATNDNAEDNGDTSSNEKDNDGNNDNDDDPKTPTKRPRNGPWNGPPPPAAGAAAVAVEPEYDEEDTMEQTGSEPLRRWIPERRRPNRPNRLSGQISRSRRLDRQVSSRTSIEPNKALQNPIGIILGHILMSMLAINGGGSPRKVAGAMG